MTEKESGDAMPAPVPASTRRLTTVLAADVVGYSRMTAADEEHAIGLLRRRFEMSGRLVAEHQGRIFNTAGDAFLAEFPSPVEAVRCSLEIQEAMASENLTAAERDRMQFRIGVNLGDVITHGSDLLGDGVNVAARLESLALPGGVCVSSTVYDLLVGKLTLAAEDLGPQSVKNIPRPIRAYRLKPEGTPVLPAPEAAAVRIAPPTVSRPRRGLLAGSLAIAAAAGAAAVAFFVLRQPPVAPASAPLPTEARVEEAAASRPLVPEDIPFVDDTIQELVRQRYLPAPSHKALAISNLNFYGYVTNRIDRQSAETEALAACTQALRSKRPDARPSAACRLYAVENEVVWTIRNLPLPPQPWIPSVRAASPPPLELDRIPVVSDSTRKSLRDWYMPIDKPKAVAIGRGGYTHMTTRPSGFAAMRSALSSCALVTDQPCFIYALGNDVMVGVPETVRVVDVLVRDDLPGANEADLHRLATTYLPDADWRAIAIGTNGKLGIALGQAGERQAIDKALRECDAAGGLGCTLRAVGPFKVAPR